MQICVPPSEPTSIDTVQVQVERRAGPVSGSIYAQQDLFPGAQAPRDSPSLADSSKEVSAFSRVQVTLRFFPEVQEPVTGSTPSPSVQFAWRSPRFRCIRLTSIRAAHAPVFLAGIAVLLAKDVISPVPPANMRSGFVSPYFIVAKKSGGLRPILDL